MASKTPTKFSIINHEKPIIYTDAESTMNIIREFDNPSLLMEATLKKSNGISVYFSSDIKERKNHSAYSAKESETYKSIGIIISSSEIKKEKTDNQQFKSLMHNFPQIDKEISKAQDHIIILCTAKRDKKEASLQERGHTTSNPTGVVLTNTKISPTKNQSRTRTRQKKIKCIGKITTKDSIDYWVTLGIPKNSIQDALINSDEAIFITRIVEENPAGVLAIPFSMHLLQIIFGNKIFN